MSERREIRSLTGLRGIAALYVVLFHYLDGLSYTTPRNVFLAHGYLAVDLFFVLSGFVMTLTYSGMFQAGSSFALFRIFLGRRIARVYPLYFVCTFCGALLVVLGLVRWPFPKQWEQHSDGICSWFKRGGCAPALIPRAGLSAPNGRLTFSFRCFCRSSFSAESLGRAPVEWYAWQHWSS